MTSCCIPQLSFSFYRHQPIRADFSGGQISSDAGLLPLRALRGIVSDSSSSASSTNTCITPCVSQHDLGWKAKRTTSLLPVAGDFFTIDFPLYRTRLPVSWVPVPRSG
jgi:hypothetical protein